jgi:hypothetical protein
MYWLVPGLIGFAIGNMARGWADREYYAARRPSAAGYGIGQATLPPLTPLSTPPIHTAYDTTDPSAEDSPSPSKAFSFSGPPGRLAAVAAANTAMHEAIDTLLSIGVMPRWVLQTANRFVYLARTHQDAAAPGSAPPVYTAYDGADPSDEDQPSPSKAFSASLPPAQLQSLRAANEALRHAVASLIGIGVKPRWVLQTANRFVHGHLVSTLAPAPVVSGYGYGT